MKTENQFLVYEEGDCPLVNLREDFFAEPKRYIVKLWCGSGYTLDGFLAWGNCEEWALIAVVAYIIDHPKYHRLLASDDVQRLYHEYIHENGLSEEEADREIEDSYTLVSCLYQGADINEYIRTENLQIIPAPQEYYHWYK